MKRLCGSCGAEFEGQRSTARFCSATCRQRAGRGAVLKPIRGESAGLVAAVRRELEAAGRVESALGQTVLALAERLESGSDTGSAVASLSRELRAALVEACRGVGAPASAVTAHRDEFAARRRARG